MCSAQSTFFYGVFVKTAYLCFASDAYKRIKGSLLGVDLICSRRHKGNLATSEGHESVKRVPEEVWKMIKPHIGRVAVIEAEQRAVSDYIGSYSCDEEEDWEYAHTWDSGMRRDWALDSFCDSGGMGEMLGGRIKDIKILLEDFGLALPYTQAYSKGEDAYFDLDALSAISLPLRSTGSNSGDSTFPSTSFEGNSDYGSVQAAVKFSKQAFAVSTNADHRIKSFLSLFRLEAVSVEMETIHPPQHSKIETATTPQAKESKTLKTKGSEATRKAAHKVVCCDKPDVEPHWHMWTISHCY